MNNITRGLFLFLVLAVLAVPVAEGIDSEHFSSSQIRVEVKGEVENPGAFTLPAYSNLSDLLELIGVGENADVSKLNGLTVLKNNDVIIIPDKVRENTRISINSGNLEELDRIPGIGPVTAQSIIDYRDTNGFFQSIDELVKVKGIGEKTLEKIREYISL